MPAESSWKKLLWKSCLFGFLVSVLISGIFLTAVHQGQQSFLAFLLSYGSLSLKILLFALILLLVFLVVLLFIPRRKSAVVAIVGFLASFFIVTSCMLPLSGWVRSSGLERVVERSQPLIEAINRYAENHGSPPHCA